MTGTYRIVVGVDGSAGGRRALRWAVAEAAARGGAVQAIMSWSCGVDMPPRPTTDQEEERRQAEEIHGRRHHSILGSVAESCVGNAACPVVVIPVPRETPQAETEPAIPV